jgi:signal transduction histidine kinase
MTTSSAPLESLPSPPIAWRLRQWPGRLIDLAVVIALLGIGTVTVLQDVTSFPRLSAVPVYWFLPIVIPLASLLVRRRYPLAVLGVTVAGVIAEATLHSPTALAPVLFVAVYTVASRLPSRVALPAIIVSGLVFIVAAQAGRPGEGLSGTGAVATVIPLAGAAIAGVYVGTRTAYIESLQQRASQVVREQQLLAEQAVAEERVRIAREMHDVIAHNLSLITVQAAALETQLRPDDPARATAESMARTGRQAMDEMRRMLGVLRISAEESPSRVPQPLIDEIPALVEHARAAGLDVDFSVEGEIRPVPPGVELSAYRITQEAITNVLKHAGPAHCRVHLRYGDDALEVRVTDDGRGAGDADVNRGHGLVGMRERVTLFGGELFAGSVPGGGFAVRATLPLTPRAAGA